MSSLDQALTDIADAIREKTDPDGESTEEGMALTDMPGKIRSISGGGNSDNSNLKNGINPSTIKLLGEDIDKPAYGDGTPIDSGVTDWTTPSGYAFNSKGSGALGRYCKSLGKGSFTVNYDNKVFGDYSFSGGQTNIVWGLGNMAFGWSNVIGEKLLEKESPTVDEVNAAINNIDTSKIKWYNENLKGSFITGAKNTVKSSGCLVAGNLNAINENAGSSLAVGISNTIQNDSSAYRPQDATIALGTGLFVNHRGLIALGRYNKKTPASNETATDYIFVIGNGTGPDNAHRRNAFAIATHDGVDTMYLGNASVTPTDLNVLKSVKPLTDTLSVPTTSTGATVPRAITTKDSGNTLSYDSAAFGKNNRISSKSFAAGEGNTSTREHTGVFGINNKIYSDYGFIVGASNQVGKPNDTNNSTAACSFVFGSGCSAYSKYCIAGGQGVIASNLGQAVLGTYNIDEPGTETIFTIGNGTLDNRSNAFNIVAERKTASIPNPKVSMTLGNATIKQEELGQLVQILDAVGVNINEDGFDKFIHFLTNADLLRLEEMSQQ